LSIVRKTLPLLALCLLILPLSNPRAADETQRGQVVGGVIHQAPPWFKQSFLEIADDVDEASASGKHVILFFQLNGCPYCDRMLTESFEAEPMTHYVREHFDVISINVRGDREIAFNEEITVTEKELSGILKVSGTPAILFLDENNKTVVRVNGYRAPERFRLILEYVATDSYRSTSLADYLDARLNKNVYQLRDEPMFTRTSDLSAIDGPLMLIFEDGSCYDCKEFHDGILGDPGVRKELERFTVVRFDADSKEKIIDLHGNATTPAELARKHEMIYRPGVLMFDEGVLLRRQDSLLFPYHFREYARYVGGGFYKKIDWRTYADRRQEELLDAGVTIDLGRPKLPPK